MLTVEGCAENWSGENLQIKPELVGREAAPVPARYSLAHNPLSSMMHEEEAVEKVFPANRMEKPLHSLYLWPMRMIPPTLMGGLALGVTLLFNASIRIQIKVIARAMSLLEGIFDTFTPRATPLLRNQIRKGRNRRVQCFT